MLRRHSLSDAMRGGSQQLIRENRRIQKVIAQSRITASPKRLSRSKHENLPSEESNLAVVFPKRRRYSMHAEEHLQSEEYTNALRSHQKFNDKLLKMKQEIQHPGHSGSPTKLARINPSRMFVDPRTEQSELAQTPAASQFDREVNEVLQGIKKNLMIFQRLFQSSRNKPQLLSKMAGWDDEFRPLLFADTQVRNLTVEQLKTALGMDRRTMRSRNFHNKLKLLLAQLRKQNTERENLLATIQKQKINDELMEIGNIERLFYSSCKEEDREQYERLVGLTRSKVLEMKNQAKDKNSLIRTIEEQTGGMTCIDNFFRRQEENLTLLESLVRKVNTGDKHELV